MVAYVPGSYDANANVSGFVLKIQQPCSKVGMRGVSIYRQTYCRVLGSSAKTNYRRSLSSVQAQFIVEIVPQDLVVLVLATVR